jgi:aldehyde dehydrogenase (NAD+)
MTSEHIEASVATQRQFFRSGATLSYAFRIERLKTLKKLVQQHEADIFAAMHADLGRADHETFVAENVVVFDELNAAIKHLKQWMRPTRVSSPLQLKPAACSNTHQPLGRVLIIAPWNYPFHLSLAPLVGAIAAGNCAIVKPSEMAPNASAVLAHIINQHFDPAHVQVIEGDRTTATQLLHHQHDLIFYTGGLAVAKSIYAEAAKHLTPVVMELGGKCPCIIHHDADLKVAARRVVWAKFMNAGQTCLAPDHLIVHRDAKDRFIALLISTIKAFYGSDPMASDRWCRIVNARHFDRIMGLRNGCTVVHDGGSDRIGLKIGPTLLEIAAMDAPIMQEEIFGPLLPVLTYTSMDEALALANHSPDPLALYLFTKDDGVKAQVLQGTRSGGVGINDCMLQAANGNMPFGGVGQSGLGSYHHRYSFDTFSHQRAIMDKSTWFDPSMRYPPYSKTNLDMLKMFSM